MAAILNFQLAVKDHHQMNIPVKFDFNWTSDLQK
jgi:hypothetical protein